MCKLFGLNIYTKGKESLISDICKFNHKVHIISGNAEVFKQPLKDDDLFEKFLDETSIIIPDGISVSLPLKIRRKVNLERITGIDLMFSVLDKYEQEDKSIYLLGASETVIENTVQNIKIKHPKLDIRGYHHGFFDIDNCDDIVNDIKDSKADAIFVAMGTPMQESFIFKYMDLLPCKLYMGVGGSFDVISGKTTRAPKIIRNIGMEWLYRMIKDPTKINRFKHNVIFTIKALLKG